MADRENPDVRAQEAEERGYERLVVKPYLDKTYGYRYLVFWRGDVGKPWYDMYSAIDFWIFKNDTDYPNLNSVKTKEDFEAVTTYQTENYYCLAPASVWFTKQAPKEIWLKLIKNLTLENATIYMLGGPDDKELCEEIKTKAEAEKVVNLAGKLSLMQSAALIKSAKRNYVNDSGPLHLASAMNAPVTAFFCSTTPLFGFGPLSDDSKILEVENLDCRPCGLHGHKECPKGNFRCGNELKI
jgi:heptosyltransferase-2